MRAQGPFGRTGMLDQPRLPSRDAHQYSGHPHEAGRAQTGGPGGVEPIVNRCASLRSQAEMACMCTHRLQEILTRTSSSRTTLWYQSDGHGELSTERRLQLEMAQSLLQLCVCSSLQQRASSRWRSAKLHGRSKRQPSVLMGIAAPDLGKLACSH